MLGEDVNFGQVAVHAQAPNPEPRQADVDLLEDQRPVVFHKKRKAGNETKRKSFLCCNMQRATPQAAQFPAASNCSGSSPNGVFPFALSVFLHTVPHAGT